MDYLGKACLDTREGPKGGQAILGTQSKTSGGSGNGLPLFSPVRL